MVCDTTQTCSGTELVSVWLVHGDSKHLHILDGDLRMKKSLFALAALGAFASAAQAQSSVTLYGTFDSSIAHITGIPLTSANVATPASTSIVTGDSTAFIDSAVASSSWGLRGSEDLGGGMKANFRAESDLLTNSGNIHSGGLFRRAANVSLADSKLGEVFLGRTGTAYVAATNQMLPLSGNTAHQWRTVTRSSGGDQVANSITYATPTIMATSAMVQHGFNNSTENGDDGTVFAAHINNNSIKNLQILAAYNNWKGIRTAQTGAGQGQAGAAYNSTTNIEGYAVGLKYKVTPAITVGTLYNHGRTNTGGSASAATSGSSTGLGAIGLGYQATPTLLLGANYAKSTFQAQMTNLQAHYTLSKRTRLYSQITMTQAAKGNAQNGGAAATSFSPIACNSSANTTTNSTANTTVSAGCHNGLAGTVGSINQPISANAYSIGVIHTF